MVLCYNASCIRSGGGGFESRRRQILFQTWLNTKIVRAISESSWIPLVKYVYLRAMLMTSWGEKKEMETKFEASTSCGAIWHVFIAIKSLSTLCVTITMCVKSRIHKRDCGRSYLKKYIYLFLSIFYILNSLGEFKLLYLKVFWKWNKTWETFLKKGDTFFQPSKFDHF